MHHQQDRVTFCQLHVPLGEFQTMYFVFELNIKLKKRKRMHIFLFYSFVVHIMFWSFTSTIKWFAILWRFPIFLRWLIFILMMIIQMDSNFDRIVDNVFRRRLVAFVARSHSLNHRVPSTLCNSPKPSRESATQSETHDGKQQRIFNSQIKWHVCCNRDNLSKRNGWWLANERTPPNIHNYLSLDIK